MTEASNEYVIMGNSAIVKCVIPSFVSDFVSVQNWQEEPSGNVIVVNSNNYGMLVRIRNLTFSSQFYLFRNISYFSVFHIHLCYKLNRHFGMM